MKVKNIQQFLNSLGSGPYPEEKVYVGSEEETVTNILVCWMAGLRGLRAAAERECDLVVCHESPFLGVTRDGDYERFMSWSVNERRKELAQANGLTVLQCHRTADSYCIADVIQEKLNLPEPAIMENMAGHEAVRIFKVASAPLKKLVEGWKEAVGMKTVRVYAPDLERPVSKIGLCWGGIGLHLNMGVMNRLVKLGVDVLLGGETEEFSATFCADMDVAFVELGHLKTEQPGMMVLADVLEERFPEITVHRFREESPWDFV
ncbi:MAG: Nif3-like dinuclear metal center hexameric protein [Planctomycetes bacterium]|nr:Nif3-like dinuclear metal center hexameric protein [Planctomycetota bacterium]